MRLAALLLSLAVPGAADATEWIRVFSEEAFFTAYADTSSIRREGAMVRMKGLYDFKRGDFTPEGRAYRSTLVDREYDCGSRRVRLLAYEDRAQPLGEGAVVSSRSPHAPRWEAVMEDSIDAAFWRMACRAP